MAKIILFVYFILFATLSALPQRIKTSAFHFDSKVWFTENKNQWDNHISYKAQLDGGAMFIENTGKFTYHLYDKDNYRARHLGKVISDKLKFHSFNIEFVGSSGLPNIVPYNPSSSFTNYFLGNNSQNWATNVQSFKSVDLKNIYPNIDVTYTGYSQSLKYDIIVYPGGNPKDIKIQYTGLNSIKLKNNNIYISTSITDFIEYKPYVYQLIENDTVEIPCKFELNNTIVSFKLLSSYDQTKTLIIDPLLVFAAQSGSTADNFGMTATYDDRGNLYSGGTAFNIGYPTTIGAYDVSFNGLASNGFTDVVITKYDSTGTSLLYSTYLGGASSSEIVTSLIVDKNDNLCLYGATGSNDFPTTAGCFQNTFAGGTPINFVFNGTTFSNGTDIFVAKFNSSGTSLLSSTYIGGSENDGVNYNNVVATYNTPYGPITEYPPDSLQYNYGDQYRGEIQVDTLSNIYIFSSTKSFDFPTQNALDNSLGGKQDAVLIKFNPTLSSLVFSTFIGGSDNDAGYALALDDTLNIYITGGTRSSDFPITAGSYNTTYGGGKCDGYLCKINQSGSSIVHSTFIGTNLYDQSYFVQLDNQQNVYVFGQSQGTMSVTAGVYFNNNGKQFIQKYNPQLSNLLAGTIFGNGAPVINISPSAFSVDCAGNIYLSGWGGNIIFGNSTSGMPITANAIQSGTDGFNFYLMVLGPNMGNLIFGSYFGGGLSREHVDGGTSRFDKRGIIYQSVCAGCGGNDDFPVTPGAWPGTPGNPNHNTDNNNCNNGVFKIDFQLNSAQANISASTLSGCAPLTVNFTNNSTAGHAYLWDFGTNDTTSIIFNPIKTYTAAGTYTANLYVKTSICNNIYDTATIIITVHPKPTAAFTNTLSACSPTLFTTNNSSGATSYQWDWGDSSSTSSQTSPTHTYSNSGTYTVSLTATTSNGCTDKVTQVINVFNFQPSVNSGGICPGSSFSLSAQGGTSYTWSPSATLSNSNTASVIASPSTTIIYSVIILNDTSSFTCAQTLTTSVVVYPSITSNFTFALSPCGNNVQFTDLSSPTPATWQWSFGNSQSSTIQNPVHFYSTSGTYTTNLIVSNKNGCSDTSIQVISLPSFPPVGVNAPTTKCESDTIQLNASGGFSYNWQPSQSLNNNTISNPLASPTVTTIYTVTIGTINGTDTCYSSLTTTVVVSPFSFNSSSVTITPTVITLGQTATVTLNGLPLNSTVSIIPNIQVNYLNNDEFTITPTKSGEYTIYVTDSTGCRHTIKTFYIEVITNICNEDVVYLPTGFTPNNDGVNDVLFIRSNFVTEVYLTIYNRWGEKLFETNDIKKGWDGIYKGKQLDQGVYGYYMTFTCNNGEKTFKKGNITLMR